MHTTVSELSSGQSVTAETDAGAATEDFAPAVTVRKSLASKEHIISLIDGRPYKSLRRHLSTNGLTPEDYRRRYKLKPDYPMVAEAYSQQRRDLAKKIGLGSKGRQTAKSELASEASPGPAPAPARKRRARTSEVEGSDT
jgi:predicted transcriptional regulator